MLYGLANEGLLPKWFGKVSQRTRVPWTGMIVTAVLMAVVLVLSFFAEGGAGFVLTLISIACVTWLLSYIVAQIDVVILRRRYPNAHRPFKTPLYPLPQIIGIAASTYLIVFIVPDMELRIVIWVSALIILAALALFGVVWLKRNRMSLFKPTDLVQTQANIIERSEKLGDEYDDVLAAAAKEAKDA
jgi:amino acid transporter